MKKDRVFIIGDVHGCLDLLKKLMDKIDWDPEDDTLIFLGDYIDRGHESKGVIDYILEIMATSSHVHCLMGNHEKIFLDYLEGLGKRTFFLNGGDKTLFSYQLFKNSRPHIPDEHRKFLSSLRLWIELEDYFVVHAGFRPGVDIKKQTDDDTLWIRDKFIKSNYDFGKKVIFGHTPFPEPLIMDNKIGLDTGAVYGNQLTCLEVPAMTFHSVRP